MLVLLARAVEMRGLVPWFCFCSTTSIILDGIEREGESPVFRKRLMRSIFVFATLAVLITVSRLGAQEPQQESSSKPPDAAAPAPAKKQAKSNKDSATKNAPDQPKWDPLRAEKDIEVGQHYMHTGDYDAAIDRFQDAIDSKPGYAIPFRYLGEAQEKKGLKKQAVKSYQRYLDLYPHAEDGAKIKKKLEKLYKEVEKRKQD
jgi:tetratricopeptide (TPR) repeat protein